MSCPHTPRPNAGPCSSCIGATARKVTEVDGVVYVDGKIAGTIQKPPAIRYSAAPQPRGYAGRRRRRRDDIEAE